MLERSIIRERQAEGLNESPSEKEGKSNISSHNN